LTINKRRTAGHRTRAYDPGVARAAPRQSGALAALTEEIVACRACPRLVEWRERVAREKRAAFRDEEYWGRPIPGFGDPRARLLVAGLAPAAHGGNRTGRIFTGDRSGDWLFGALYRNGYANQPTSVRADDGLELHDAYVAAAVRCAPPANKPTPAERDRCLPYLVRELELLDRVRVVVVLGQFAYDAIARVLAASGSPLPAPRPRFGHGVEVPSCRAVVICCYHPSQQNTFTGKLTEPMLDAVFARARALSGS
jgi:uracil-DNA glycosylase family 4